MDVSLIMKVTGIGLLACAAYILLSKSGKEELGMLVSLTGVIIILILIVDEAAGLFETIRRVFGL